jgi:hypothetical protein
MLRGSAAWFLIAALLCGCEPALWIKGSVRRSLTLEPVGQATVKTVCPPDDSDEGDISTVTSAQGQFEAHGSGSVGKKCVLEVTVADEPKYEFEPLDYCVDEDAQQCRTLEAHLLIGR